GPIRPTTSWRCSSSVTSWSARTPSKDRETEEARSASPGLLSTGAACVKSDLRDDLGRHRADVVGLVVLDLDHAVLPSENGVQLLGEADLAAQSRNLLESLELVREVDALGRAVGPLDRDVEAVDRS